MHLDFPDTGGDCCVKSGYVKGADSFVVKVAGTIPCPGTTSTDLTDDTWTTGGGFAVPGHVASGGGVMNVFSQHTGRLSGEHRGVALM